MLIRTFAGADRAEWLRRRRALWPEAGHDEHDRETAAHLQSGSGPVAVFVAERNADGDLGGFLELVPP